MLVFVPYPDFRRCGRVLDKSRLLNQVTEESPLLLTAIKSYDEFPLENKTPWANYPAARMFQGYLKQFCYYNYCLIVEAQKRFTGIDNLLNRWAAFYLKELANAPECGPTPWSEWRPLFQSHRANLSRKNPKYYQFYWTEIPSDKYEWPVHYRRGVFFFTRPEEWLLDYRLPLPEVWVMALKERLL